MTKARINQLHRIAEFQKKLAWANYNYAQGSTLFKQELLACAKQAADNCRETRQMIKDAILNEQWAAAGAPADYWD